MASGREYEMNASGERERERYRERERERGEERGQVERTGPGRDVSRCKPSDDVERREPRRARDSYRSPRGVGFDSDRSPLFSRALRGRARTT